MNLGLLGTVIGAGLIDSLNPCAISILLIFITLLFTLEKTKKEIAVIVFAYISAIYATYVLIGLGILRSVMFFGVNHFFSVFAGFFAIAFGLFNLWDFFFAHKVPLTKISIKQREKVSSLAFKASVPAALGLGVFIGLCEFPCSGAIYVAILGMLSYQTSFVNGLVYLLIYNFMFVLPLILIYLITQNRYVADKLTSFQEQKGKYFNLILGIFMLVLGTIMLFLYL